MIGGAERKSDFIELDIVDRAWELGLVQIYQDKWAMCEVHNSDPCQILNHGIDFIPKNKVLSWKS